MSASPIDSRVDRDLDALVPPANYVKFAGHRLKLPGDLPLEIHLRVQQALSDTEDSRGAETLRDALLELLLWNEDAGGAVATDIREALRPLSASTMITLINGAYRDDEDVDYDEEAAAAGEASASPETAEATPTTTGLSQPEPNPTQSSTETTETPTALPAG